MISRWVQSVVPHPGLRKKTKPGSRNISYSAEFVSIPVFTHSVTSLEYSSSSCSTAAPSSLSRSSSPWEFLHISVSTSSLWRRAYQRRSFLRHSRQEMQMISHKIHEPLEFRDSAAFIHLKYCRNIFRVGFTYSRILVIQGGAVAPEYRGLTKGNVTILKNGF